MHRRNIVPNPAPSGTTGWNHSESNATLTTFNNASGLHYKATATAAECQAGVLWNDASAITVRPGETYGLRIHISVAGRPTVGYLRAVVLWYELDGTTGISTWFGADMAAGVTDVNEVITAPDGAYRATVAILYLTTPAMTPDTVTPVEFTATQFLLEPLGPPVTARSDAVTNLVMDPSVEYGGFDWLPHTHDDNVVLPGTTFAPQTGWASQGSHSMRHTITATAGIITGTTFYGFVGSYVGGLYEVAPGDELTWQCDVKVLAAPLTGPGVFLEIFYYFYDGDPAHTALLQHTNGDSVFQPPNIGAVQTLSMSATAPVGATHAQVTVVMASGAPSALLDFYADAAVLTKNETTAAWFDGDSAGSGWTGIPGKSTSRRPDIDAPVPGDWFDGDTDGAQWEGVASQSMSTYCPPILRHTADVSPVPSVEAMRFVVAASAPI